MKMSKKLWGWQPTSPWGISGHVPPRERNVWQSSFFTCVACTVLQKLFHNVPVVLPTVFCSHFCFCDIRQAVPWYIWPTQMLSICSHKKLTAEEPEDGLVSRSSCIHTDSEVRSCHSLAQYWHSFLILYNEKITVKTAAIVLYINLWFDHLMAIWARAGEQTKLSQF